MLKQLQKAFSVVMVILIASLSLSFVSPEPALASVHLDFQLPKKVYRVLSNRQLVADAKRFLNTSPETFCRAYFDNLNGVENSSWSAIEEGAGSAFAILQAVNSASVAGAGSLTGYAGIASAVSQLGLGGLTTAIAGMMGSNVVGAAATAVVTSAVGGPAVMGALVVGGTGATAFGTYKLGSFTVKKLGKWASGYCR